MQKLFFYPLCMSCERAAVIENTLCMSCTKHLFSSLQSNSNDVLLRHNELTSRLWGSVRQEKNSRSYKILWRLYRKKSALKHLAKQEGIDSLVLVPSSKRQNYSGMEIFAHAIAIDLGLEFCSAVLEKTESRAQHGLRAKERLDTPLFIKLSSGAENKVAGKRILLFDDVCTTGTSLFQAEVVLRKAGAIFVLPYTLLKKELKKFEGEEN